MIRGTYETGRGLQLDLDFMAHAVVTQSASEMALNGLHNAFRLTITKRELIRWLRSIEAAETELAKIQQSAVV